MPLLGAEMNGMELLLCAFSTRKGVNSSVTISFLSKTELYNHLEKNEDGYFNTFHENDYRVRKVSNIQEYLPQIQKSVCDPSPDIQEKIKKNIYFIQEKISNQNNYNGIHVPTFLALPWKIGCIQGTLYENGYPHTRSDVIILNVNAIHEMSDKSLCRILIHEKVHVYQKMYPQEMDSYLVSKQIFPLRKRDYSDKLIPANPDLNQYIYHGYGAFYDKSPSKFKDVRYLNDSSSSEHPLEEMAYEWQKILDEKE